METGHPIKTGMNAGQQGRSLLQNKISYYCKYHTNSFLFYCEEMKITIILALLKIGSLKLARHSYF